MLVVIAVLLVLMQSCFSAAQLREQKRRNTAQIAIIPIGLLFVFLLAYVFTAQVSKQIAADPGHIAGFLFLLLGLWKVLQYAVVQSGEACTGNETCKAMRAEIGMGIDGGLITISFTFLAQDSVGRSFPFVLGALYLCSTTFVARLTQRKHHAIITPRLSYTLAGVIWILCGMMSLFLDLGMG